MASQDIYAQAPLVTEQREIRILSLAPGIGNSVLRGDLIVESLNDDDLHYTALSYTWSGPISQSSIIIGRVPLHITENLELALRRIRRPYHPKNMWIDAICINQSDNEEKSVQVFLMGDIYANAARTIVWLGEQSANSDMAMDFIHALRQKSRDEDSGDDSLSDDEDPHADDTRKGISDSNQIALQAVTNLMQRQWWTRIWVIQEALKSRRVTVVCGAKEVDIAYFAQLVKARKLRSGFQMKPRIPSEQPFVEVLSDWNICKTQTETGGLPLLDLIVLTHRFQASVLKDKIYALLGLATPDARSWIVPDYSDAMSYHMILIRLTTYFLQFSSRPLRFASHCRATNCPSWVSDWTAIDSRIIKLIDREDADFKNVSKSESMSKHSERSARSLERLPHSAHTAAKFNPRFDAPLQNLTKYQIPATLLVHGILVDRVSIAFQVPTVRSVSGNGPETDMSSFKAKIREWETRMTEYLETYQSERGRVQWKPQWRKVTISKHEGKKALQKRDLKTSLIKYLERGDLTNILSTPSGVIRLDRLNFYGQITCFHELVYNTDEATETISDYEEWLQRQNDCKVFSDHPYDHPDPSASRSIIKKLRRTDRLGRKIVKSNAGKTMFLTDDGHHYSVTFAVIEGDIICRLWHSFYYLILRRAGDEHWTLVGYIPDCASLEVADKVDRDHARAKTEVFKLI